MKLTYKNTYWQTDEKLSSGQNAVETPWGVEMVKRSGDSETGRTLSYLDACRMRQAMLAKMPLADWSARAGSFRVVSVDSIETMISAGLFGFPSSNPLFDSQMAKLRAAHAKEVNERLDEAEKVGAPRPVYVAREPGTIIDGATASTVEELHRRVAAIVDFAGDEFERRFFRPGFEPLHGYDEAITLIR